MNDDMSYFFLAGLFFVSSLLFAVWKRWQVVKVHHSLENNKESWRRIPVANMIIKIIILGGMICVMVSTIMQGRDMKRKSSLRRIYKDTVSSYVTSVNPVEGGLRIRGRLYNGLNSPIHIVWTNRIVIFRALGPDKCMFLNGFSNCPDLISLTPGQELLLDFVLPQNVSSDIAYGILYAQREGSNYTVRTNYLSNVVGPVL